MSQKNDNAKLVQVYDPQTETYRLCWLIGKILKLIKTGRRPFRKIKFHKKEKENGTGAISEPKNETLDTGRKAAKRSTANQKAVGSKVSGRSGQSKKGKGTENGPAKETGKAQKGHATGAIVDGSGDA